MIYSFSKITFSKNISEISSVLNSLDPDQAQHLVGPSLGPNCLQRLLPEDSSRQNVRYERRFNDVQYIFSNLLK